LKKFNENISISERLREIELTKKLKHYNCMQCVDYDSTPQHKWMLMPLALK